MGSEMCIRDSTYIDMDDDSYELVTLWIIGTYIYDSFETYPYLFINAMRGSGKSRLLKIIKEISYEGVLNTSMRESVLFRMGKKTLCIDEFEHINSKEALALREVLNASYKKGITISRMRKVKTATGEGYEQEDFEPYKPIAMANIWGMEEVLGDRCVTIILEKSSDERRTRLSEDFVNNPVILSIKNRINAVLVYMCSLFGGNILKEWNNYINERYNYTTTYNTYNTLNTLNTPFTRENLENEKDKTGNEKNGKNENDDFSVVKCSFSVVSVDLLDMFNRIHDTGINGRNLELMMPFIVLGKAISEEVFTKILDIATRKTKERKENEIIESKDVMLIDFISKLPQTIEFKTVRQLTVDFREFIGKEEGEDKWINARWVGRALKRLKLIKEKRRVSQGVEIIANIPKAIEKMELFKKKKDDN